MPATLTTLGMILLVSQSDVIVLREPAMPSFERTARQFRCQGFTVDIAYTNSRTPTETGVVFAAEASLAVERAGRRETLDGVAGDISATFSTFSEMGVTCNDWEDGRANVQISIHGSSPDGASFTNYRLTIDQDFQTDTDILENIEY